MVSTVCPVCESRMKYWGQLNWKRYQETPFVFVCTRTDCSGKIACSSESPGLSEKIRIITYLNLPERPSPEEETLETPLERLTRELLEKNRVLEEREFCIRAFPELCKPASADAVRFDFHSQCFVPRAQHLDPVPMPEGLEAIQVPIREFVTYPRLMLLGDSPREIPREIWKIVTYIGPRKQIAEIAKRLNQMLDLAKEIKSITH